MIAPNAGVGAHINIPILAGAALGYRANSGDWPTIQQQQGSRTQARVTSAGYRAARNLDAPWNPLRPLARQQSMYLRKEHEDNRTRTAVSVAMDLRDTLTFRKPKPTFQGADTVTIYVVYALRVLDTSSVAFDLWNSERWERGEVAAYEVPAEHHLGQIDVERFYDPANGHYVVGRIVVHRTLNSERWDALPTLERDALRQLWATLAVEQLRWFEWGSMNVGETRRRTIAVHDLNAAMRAPTESAKIAAMQTVYHQVRYDWMQARTHGCCQPYRHSECEHRPIDRCHHNSGGGGAASRGRRQSSTGRTANGKESAPCYCRRTSGAGRHQQPAAST